MRSRTVTLLGACLALWAMAHASFGGRYTETKDEVKSAGSIVGRVVFDGKAPAAKPIEIKHPDKACHTSVPDESLVVSKSGGIQWAVVHIRKIKSGKPFRMQAPHLDQVGCRFKPHVALVRVKQPLKVLNSDGILHNVHVYGQRNAETNIAMVGSSEPLELSFRRREIVRVGCDVHPWMGAWIVVMDHPYYVVTGPDGSFKLENVPAGTYTLAVWHERLGKLQVEVTVAPGKESRVDFKLKRGS